MKTLFLVFAVALLLPIATKAQLLNGDFEDNNDTVAANWSYFDFGTGLKTDYKHSGDYAVAVWNWYYYGPGYTVNGNEHVSMFGNMEGAGTPTTDKALRLTGHYFYDTTGTDTDADTALITIAFRKRGSGVVDYDTVAFGKQYFLPTSGGSMVPFSIPIADLAPGIDPDTMVIFIQSSLDGFCESSGGGNCLYFYVDDLKLENTTGVLNVSHQFKPLGIYPNPASNMVSVSATEGTTWNLYDISGKLIHSIVLTAGQNNIDLSAQPAGMYMVVLAQQGIVLGREKLIKQ